MLQTKYYLPSPGETNLLGYGGKLLDFIITKQLTDDKTWAVLVDQFRLHSDVENNWRGEFWGKMMRGGCLSYCAKKSKTLYKSLTTTVLDLLTTQDKDGRISSYPRDREFKGWDMWSRKYVLLGLLNYYDICESQSLKRKVLNAAKRHANYILKYIGPGKKQKDIFETSQIYGGLNSCSILEPFMKLYMTSGEQKYLDFATYIVNKGFCKDLNIIKACEETSLYPYEFTTKKAYEMMSCFEGLLEYYKVTNNPLHLKAVINFVDMIYESDYTIIGCSGCTTEFFDHSAIKQTEYKDDIMQETCVTVTFMNLVMKLLLLTGEAKYAAMIETSSFNAMYGSVNNTNQTMINSRACVWISDPPLLVSHESYPFDSYSPLYKNRRGRGVGGFLLLQNGRSYGCCACNGSSGIATSSLYALLKDDKGFVINLFNDFKYKDDKVKISIKANLYQKSKAKISIVAKDESFRLSIRKPDWAKNIILKLNGKPIGSEVNELGYFILNRLWNNDVIEISFKMPLVMHALNDKVGFTRGPIVLTADSKLSDLDTKLDLKIKDGKSVSFKLLKDNNYNEKLILKTRSQEIPLVDYSEAGKNYDDINHLVTVWHDVK